MARPHKISANQAVSFLLLCMGSVVMIVPFIWMILTSFKTFRETIQIPIKWLPDTFMPDNYVTVMNKLDFTTYYANTMIVTFTTLIAQLFICSLAAYSFARLKFRFKNFLFLSLLCVLMVPPQMTIIPRYLMMDSFGWVNTYKALIIPMIPSAYGTFFLRQFFMTLPAELEDSAKIDGCSYFRIYWNIMLPLCTSALVAFGMFTFLHSWNDLLWPLIATSSEQRRVLSVGLATLQGSSSNGTQYQLLAAASVMATIPTLLIYIIGQKYFVKGIALSGIKG